MSRLLLEIEILASLKSAAASDPVLAGLQRGATHQLAHVGGSKPPDTTTPKNNTARLSWQRSRAPLAGRLASAPRRPRRRLAPSSVLSPAPTPGGCCWTAAWGWGRRPSAAFMLLLLLPPPRPPPLVLLLSGRCGDDPNRTLILLSWNSLALEDPWKVLEPFKSG